MTSIKNPNERVVVSFQVPVMLQEKIIKAAKARGQTFSLFARDSLNLCAHFSPEFWGKIEALGEVYGVGESWIIESIVKEHITGMMNHSGVRKEEKSETVENKKIHPRRKSNPLAARL